MKQYLDLLRHVRDNGMVKTDRTGTGTRSVFGYQMRFNLQEGFPLLTTKKVHMRAIIHELIWFLAGDTNIKYLLDNDVHIWDEWADADGNLGPIYGYQWRSWPGKIEANKAGGFDGTENWEEVKFDKYGQASMPDYTNDLKQESIDQITQVLDQIKNNPDSRRMIVSAWNPADIPSMKLPPCHALFQFYTRELTTEQRIASHKAAGHSYDLDIVSAYKSPDDYLDSYNVATRYLDCQLYQRSADVFIGVPFNIASYAMLTHMLAQQANMLPGEFVWTGGDCHLYSNHMEQVELQLSRNERALPELHILRKPDSIFDYKFEDFEVVGYAPHPAIKAQVAV